MAWLTTTFTAKVAVLLTFAGMLSVASADQAGTSPIATVPAQWTSSDLSLQVSGPDGADDLPNFTVIPLTASAGLNQSDVQRGLTNIRGTIAIMNQTSYINFTDSSDAVAYLSCDPINNSFITPNTILDTLMQDQPKAILLYSLSGNCCGLQRTNLDYQSIFTMTDARESGALLNVAAAGIVQASITGNATNPNPGPGGSIRSSSSSSSPLTGNNSAVAMSVLYSITGLIVLLFLIIITTGAIRAHRYPERYGPRAGHAGRPRQSRARGLARAVLETLPIVKFGDPEPQKPDPTVELESVHVDREEQQGDAAAMEVTPAGRDLPSIPEDEQQQQQQQQQQEPQPQQQEPHQAQQQQQQTIEGDETAASDAAPEGPAEGPAEGVGAQTPPPAAAAAQDDQGKGADSHLGCSICTEDFTVGEDVRVLPCNHKFHPACIDPWLINVSGTCPLCRLDLRPQSQKADGTDPAAEGGEMPPPLGADGHEHDDEHEHGAAAGSSQHRRRVSQMFDLHRLRHAPVEERIEALRRYRTQTAAAVDAAGEVGTRSPSAASENHEEERGRRASLTARLRELFHIRTREAQAAPSVAEHSSGAAGDEHGEN